MNLMNFFVLPNPDVPNDYLIFGDIYDSDNNFVSTFGENGTSVFGWWALQDVAFQTFYSSTFGTIMAQQIVNGTAE
jgi:hypothetical protein